jgi:predicted metal-dependent phosphoesterase TrpH
MPVDLHTHSRYSDGSDRPSALVRKAAVLGLSAVALTDHDTLEGIPEASATAREVGIELVPGVEVSCEWAPGTLHMVVLFLEPGPGPLQDLLADLQAARAVRNREIVHKLNQLGIAITIEEVIAESKMGLTGRPHIAAVLVRHGVVPDIPAAFDEYLANGKPAYAPRRRLTPQQTIASAKASGALPILTHPYTMGLASEEAFRAEFARLAGLGLVGIDCYYPEYTPEEREALAAVTRSFGMVPSGGSDYHGSYKEGLALGTGWGDLVVPDSVLAELKVVRNGLRS